jgi:nitrite reductase/ring-hydroxylating ferredoxin subunit
MSADEFPVSGVPAGSAIELGDCAVFNVGNRIYATQAKCTHRGGPLAEGTLEGSTVTCPYHGAQFDVTTGALRRGPADAPLQTYPVSVINGIGHIEAPASTA